VRITLALAGVVLAVVIGGCGADDDEAGAPVAGADPGLIHVHGLGVNPLDGALFAATHNGLFRAAANETPQRVGDSRQDVMGFTVIGPDRFLASGHPDGRTDDPPLLGLIESGDAGKTWNAGVLRGEADFHLLRTSRQTLYAQDSQTGRVFEGPIGGSSLSVRRSPQGELIDFAVDPEDPQRLVAATDRGLAQSSDGARSWKALDRKRTGLLVAPGPSQLVLVDGSGRVQASDDAGRTWRSVGAIDGPPAAFHSRDGVLYVAVHDGPVLQSDDGGRTWTTRIPAP